VLLNNHIRKEHNPDVYIQHAVNIQHWSQENSASKRLIIAATEFEDMDCPLEKAKRSNIMSRKSKINRVYIISFTNPLKR